MPSPQVLARAVCTAVPLAWGALAVLLDQDANWDLRNYHWYNAYAFLNDRWDIDVIPAQIPSFYNPTLDVPFFLLAQAVPARMAGFVLGVVQGLNVIPLYFIGLALLPQRHVLAAGLALIGMLGGGNLGLVGTTFYDNVVSLFVLSSIAAVVARPNDRMRWFLLAGFLVGAGTGLKLPTAVFAVGLAVAVFMMPGQRLARVFAFGLGGLAGLGLFAGHWMVFLWQAFHNPIFPYFNAVFDSPFGVAASYRDTRFAPDAWLEALAFPLVTALDPMQAGEIVFRDYRIAAAFVVLIMTGGFLLLRRAQPASLTARYLIVAVIASYVVWLGLFAIYRYIIPLEMLAPLVIVAAVSLWPVSAVLRSRIITGVLIAVTLSAAPGTWGRIPWGETFIDVAAPDLPDPGRSMILMLGTTPTSWVIPSFPGAAAFVRIQGFGLNPEDGDTGLNNRVRERIAAHGGDFYTLAGDFDRPLAETLLARYGLVPDPATCRTVRGNLADRIELCAAARTKVQDP
jgi:hypothetical protein